MQEKESEVWNWAQAGGRQRVWGPAAEAEGEGVL